MNDYLKPGEVCSNLKYQEEHFTPGHTVEKSHPSKPKEDNIVFIQ